jgi:hypothetical protein
MNIEAPPKDRLAFNELHGFTSVKVGLLKLPDMLYKLTRRENTDRFISTKIGNAG